MPRKSKLPRYDAFNASENAFGPRAQPPEDWPRYLDATKPLTLELGCGKAELSRGLAEKYPNHNFIGIDLKADRLWRAAKDSLEAGLDNIAFMQLDILQIGEVFAPDSVDEIWLTFPDPFPKNRHAKHRMLNRNFLDIYKNILKPGCSVHLKTDNLPYFAWAWGLLIEQDDVMLSELTFDLHGSIVDEDAKIMTFYEKRFIKEGLPINYLRFNFV